MSLILLDKTKIEVIAYNEKADYCIQNLRISDMVFVYGEIKENKVNIKEMEKFVSHH